MSTLSTLLLVIAREDEPRSIPWALWNTPLTFHCFQPGFLEAFSGFCLSIQQIIYFERSGFANGAFFPLKLPKMKRLKNDMVLETSNYFRIKCFLRKRVYKDVKCAKTMSLGGNPIKI